jgi:hypothetical protein
VPDDRDRNSLVEDVLRLRHDLGLCQAHRRQLEYQLRCYQSERATLVKRCNEQGRRIIELEQVVRDLEMAMKTSTDPGLDFEIVEGSIQEKGE